MIKAANLEGSSMAPLFRAGNLVLYETRPEAAAGWLTPGDCALYDYEGRRLLHRALEVRRDGAVLGDDGGRLAPHFVPWSAIAGKALSANPLKKGMPGLAYCLTKRLLARVFK